eukprot:TRINITY_DN11122_c0_g1_i1.p1 TRINITY_DN11122_c0_g1~~TRINITY_DN11122_c0_g1_i1.p1  ORF type:complete len:260 (+),score=55.50 TRINITY_DN11122_c0_g1_i1:107-886(+)
MGSLELLSPEGLRIDGRRAEELRKVTCRMGVIAQADGSAYLQQGNTKLVATVYGPCQVSERHQALHDRAVIKCEFSSAPFSTGERKRKSKQDRRAAEMALLLRETFESVILTTLYPRSQIEISVSVLQADGATRSAALNAAALALVEAGVAMRQLPAACAVGRLDGTLVLDPNQLEEQHGAAALHLAVLPGSRAADTGSAAADEVAITTVQLEARLSLDQCQAALELATAGARALHRLLLQAVESRSLELLQARGAVPP